MYKIIGGDQKEYGPVGDDELRRWIAEGRLNGQSRARPEGELEWRPLASFPEFTEDLRAQAGAAVPAMPPFSSHSPHCATPRKPARWCVAAASTWWHSRPDDVTRL